MATTFLFDEFNRVITVEAPTTDVTVQEIINAIRDWEDELENMDIAKIATASGKESLGGGLAVGITLELLNNWQFKFEDRLGPTWVICTVTGGNLVGGIAGNPIRESTYTQVRLILSAAGTIAGLGEVAQEASVQELAAILGIPTSTIANDIDSIAEKTDNLPADPAAQSLVEAYLTTEIDDLITRPKGLDAIHDSLVVRALEETLQIVKELVKARASFKT